MKVSIVIPLYNKAPYVRRTLDSVAAQTFSDFEVIVVDDGSTDGGAEIVAGYGDSRFRLLTQANAGPGAARNTGIAQAEGEFTAFLDADDEWFPTFLERGVRCLEELRHVASYTSGYIEYPSTQSREKMWRRRGVRAGVHSVEPQTAPWLVVSWLAYMTSSSTVARTEVLRKWKGFYSEGKCLFAEDAFLWLKLLLNEKVAFDLAPLVHIHTEASGLSSNLRGARPVEPFLKDPAEIEAACPPHLRELLSRVFAIRAAKTACMLGYWGHWREASSLMKRFTARKHWRLPYYAPAVVCSTPVGAALGRTWRGMNALFD